MPENTELNRRDFLKVAGVGAAALALLSLRNSTPETGEILKQNEVSIAALRTKNHLPGESDLAKAVRKLDEIRRTVRTQPLDLLITPEYSFDMRYGQNKDYKPMPLVFEQKGEEFVVSQLKSHNATRIIIEMGQEIAHSYNTNLLLATFLATFEKDHIITSLFINREGKITGLKKKDNLPPIGKFEIKRGEKVYKILPMICGEVFNIQKSDFTTSDFKCYPPDWVIKGAPWDIFAHSMAQGDLDFDKLGAIIQKRPIPEDSLPHDVVWLRKAFNSYYGEYAPYLGTNSPILVADNSMVGCFNKDLSPMKIYEDRGEFIVAKCNLTQPDQ